ncbi:MAG: exo-alpha-sialidase [Rhodopirellula sp.]|nr:exo-alpha-sialidase [Rhodopirellula sp.]
MASRWMALSAALLLCASAAFADDLFEEVHALKWNKGAHGYRGSMGDFVRLSDGSIVMSFTQEGIMATASQDGGRTWGEPRALAPNPKPPAKGYYCHPSFLRLEDGQILLSYIYATFPTTPYYGHNYYRRSADDGKTWTDPFVLTPHPGYVIMHNDRLSLLSTGRIVGIAEYKAYYPSTADHSGYVGIAFFSDDGGYSWQVSKNTVDMHPVEVQEADAVELKDGRVMMFARTYSGYPVRAYSDDQCQTWSKGEPIAELPMPYAGMPTVRRIPSTGDLLFIWISERSQDSENPQINRRCALTAAVSKDEGKTFGPFRHIARDPEDDFGYQCVEFLEDDTVLVGYHARDGIHVARIKTDWFYKQPQATAKGGS